MRGAGRRGHTRTIGLTRVDHGGDRARALPASFGTAKAAIYIPRLAAAIAGTQERLDHGVSQNIARADNHRGPRSLERFQNTFIIRRLDQIGAKSQERVGSGEAVFLPQIKSAHSELAKSPFSKLNNSILRRSGCRNALPTPRLPVQLKKCGRRMRRQAVSKGLARGSVCGES